MKVTEYGTIRSVSDLKRRRTGSASATSFADLLDASSADTEPVASLSDLAVTASVDNMLALQEISEEEVARKKLVQKGKNLLDEMDRLRQQLLVGAVPYSTLQNLGRQLSIQRQSVSDPVLLSIMDDIELRAAVELAKLERAATSSPSPSQGEGQGEG